jgi:DNA primase
MRAAFSQQFVDEVRNRNNIVDVIAEYVALKQSGENFKGLCPFHTEKTPSFVVSPTKQLFHCFGCGVGGNVFQFLMQYCTLSFSETVSTLAQRAGMSLPRFPRDQGNLEEEDKGKELYRVNEAVAAYYHHLLHSTVEGERGFAYLEKRGISARVVDTFHLGYAPSQWDRLVKTLTKKGFSPALLQTGGLIKPRTQGKGYYDLFRDRIIFPIRDVHGRVVAFGGRTIDDSQEPKYLNSPETPVYRKGAMLYGLPTARQAIRRAGYVLVVEGYFDLLTVWQAGVEQIVAPLGTALTRQQVQLLHRYTQEIVLVFDGDQAGKAAMERGNALLMDEEMRVRVVALPPGNDPDTFVRTQGAEAFQQLLSGALPFVEHLIRMGATCCRSIEEKMRYINALLPLIAKISHQVERMEYLALLAEKANVSEQALHRELQKHTPRERAGQQEAIALVTLVPARAEQELISLLLEDPKSITAVKEEITPEEFTDTVLGEIACFLFALDEKGIQVTPAQLIDLLPQPHWKERVSQLLLQPTPCENRAQLLGDYLSVMRGRRIKQQAEMVKARAEEAEKQGDTAEAARFLQQFMALQRALREQGKGGKGGERLVQNA